MPSAGMLPFTATIGTHLIIFDCAVNSRLDLTPPLPAPPPPPPPPPPSSKCGESHNPESYCALGKDNPRFRSRATRARGMSISLSLRAGGQCDVFAPSVASVGQQLNSARGSGERHLLFPSSATLPQVGIPASNSVRRERHEGVSLASRVARRALHNAKSRLRPDMAGLH